MSDSLQPHGLYSPWNPPGQNTGVGRVAFCFSRRFSQPRDRTQVSHIAGGFFTLWATRAYSLLSSLQILFNPPNNLIEIIVISQVL